MSEISQDSSTAEEQIHKPHYKRNVSGELDVFEATQYFSDFNEPSTTMENSRIQIQKQSIVQEHRQNRIHPETGRVLVVKPKEKEKTTRGGSKKLTSFLNSLLRSAGLKKSSKSTLEVETPRGERKMRRKSCVLMTTHAVQASPISGTGAWSLNVRRRSFDEKESKKRDQKLKFKESLWSDKRVRCRNDGCESDSSSDESDLFELDLFAKSNPLSRNNPLM